MAENSSFPKYTNAIFPLHRLTTTNHHYSHMTILAIKTSRLAEWTFSRQTANTAANKVSVNYDQDIVKRLREVGEKGFFLLEKKGASVEVKSLEEINQYICPVLENIWFRFLDTSSIDNTPSWVLRNYLAFIKLKLSVLERFHDSISCYKNLGKI